MLAGLPSSGPLLSVVASTSSRVTKSPAAVVNLSQAVDMSIFICSIALKFICFIN